MVYLLCCINFDFTSPTFGVNAGILISAISIALSIFEPFLGFSDASPLTISKSPCEVKNILSILGK